MIDRRKFVSGAVCTAVVASSGFTAPKSGVAVPSYLVGREDLYATNPRKAAQAWFRDARFGLFLHYGLYSILGRHEWVQYREKIPIAEYEKLADRFAPDKFDADKITDLALEAGMKYVNLTSKHHDGFCLFDTGTANWNSVAVASRDLCADLAEQCQKKGLGCFFYYSLLADWHHPYFYPRKFNPIARPAYKTEPEQYLFEKDEDFAPYLDEATGHLRALLTNYGPIAGIWIDPLMGYYGRPDLFPMKEIYSTIRQLQPQCLISAKQGITGTEDFAAPERSGHSLEDRIRKQYGDKAGDIAAAAWKANKSKHIEVCDTLQPQGWGYIKADDGRHKTPDQVMNMLAIVREKKANLLLNAGPLPDGSIHPADVKTLREVGKRFAKNG